MTQTHDDQIICGEGYGPGGVAVLVTCREPSAALALAVRQGFAEQGGYSGAAGSVAYLFNLVGIVEFAAAAPLTKMCAFAFEAGAEDVVGQGDGSLHVLTDPVELALVSERLVRRGCAPVSMRVAQRAATRVRIEARQELSLQQLRAALQAIEGVTHVYDNAEIPALLA
jgi:transcriptional/translational regulatory protein YebC/TACO1